MNSLTAFFKGFLEGFRHFGHIVMNIVNFALLLVVYVFGIGIVSIVSKISGREFLGIKKTPKGSYWIKREWQAPEIKRAYRQF